VEDPLIAASAPRAQLKNVAQNGDRFDPAPRHPVDDFDFGFLNDDCSISDIVRVCR
jgi:hypothetical protein